MRLMTDPGVKNELEVELMKTQIKHLNKMADIEAGKLAVGGFIAGIAFLGLAIKIAMIFMA